MTSELVVSIKSLFKVFMSDKKNFKFDYDFVTHPFENKCVKVYKRYFPNPKEVIYIHVELCDSDYAMCVEGNLTSESGKFSYHFRNKDKSIYSSSTDYEFMSNYFFNKVGSEFQRLIENIILDLI